LFCFSHTQLFLSAGHGCVHCISQISKYRLPRRVFLTLHLHLGKIFESLTKGHACYTHQFRHWAILSKN
jgi:hypothetical protein